MKEYSFLTAYTQARELYGLELNPDEFESIGLLAWDAIGNRRCRLYKFEDTPIKTSDGGYYIDLPCNVDLIESVTADYEDYQRTSATEATGGFRNGWIEDLIDDRKYNTNFLYSPGKFIKYRIEGNTMFLADDFSKVIILYKGIIADETGLPFLTDKEVKAIAVYCAYVDMFRRALVTKDQATLQLSQILKNEWNNMCSRARVPSYINQNEMDSILDAATSWDRKRFGRSYKPMR